MTNDYEKIKDKLSNQTWRLNNLYYIKDKSGKKVLMRMNWAQDDLYSNIWYYNVILKARQLGFTTFVMMYFLDSCLFNSNHSAGIIAHTRDDAEDLFKNKIKFAYDNLPDWLKELRLATSDTARTLEFSNGSQINVGTSLRSGTYQKLLVSEYGKVSAKFPDKAKEIKTGALNTVEQGQQIFVESTAEGKAGEFFNMCEQGRKLKASKAKLTPLQPKFHFYAWFDNPEYTLSDEDAALTPIPDALREYFRDLNIELTPNQKAWYAAKFDTMGFDMKREFPSTPLEAFEGSLEGAYYTKEMEQARRDGRVTRTPYDPAYGVYTAWDLGINDLMTCWFFQHIGGQLRFIDYHESSGQGWNFYKDMLLEKGYNYKKHFFPHDGNKRIRGKEVTTDKKLAEELGISPIVVVERTGSVSNDIRNHCKPTIALCVFDNELAATGLVHIDNYRKRWDKQVMMFKDEPLHDEASHGADGFRTAVMAYRKNKLDGVNYNSVENKAGRLKTLSNFSGRKSKALRNGRRVL